MEKEYRRRKNNWAALLQQIIGSSCLSNRMVNFKMLNSKSLQQYTRLINFVITKPLFHTLEDDKLLHLNVQKHGLHTFNCNVYLCLITIFGLCTLFAAFARCLFTIHWTIPGFYLVSQMNNSISLCTWINDFNYSNYTNFTKAYQMQKLIY
jgi:hypothetical protein